LLLSRKNTAAGICHCEKVKLTLPALWLVLLFMLSTTLLTAEPAGSLRVGVSIPLSGPVAEYGEAVRNGITLAIKQNPKAFKSIRFIYSDNRYDPKTAVSTFVKHKTADHIQLLYSFDFPIHIRMQVGSNYWQAAYMLQKTFANDFVIVLRGKVWKLAEDLTLGKRLDALSMDAIVALQNFEQPIK